jgi:hypothetical protein
VARLVVRRLLPRPPPSRSFTEMKHEDQQSHSSQLCVGAVDVVCVDRCNRGQSEVRTGVAGYYEQYVGFRPAGHGRIGTAGDDYRAAVRSMIDVDMGVRAFDA